MERRAAAWSIAPATRVGHGRGVVDFERTSSSATSADPRALIVELAERLDG